MEQSNQNAVSVYHSQAQTASSNTCQLFQLLFWNIRYPFVPLQNKPWKSAGSACTDYRMRAYGRVRTSCVEIVGMPPQALMWAQSGVWEPAGCPSMRP